MPYWGWILLIAGLSALALASVLAIVHHTHRRLPAQQAAEGGPEDLSAPLPAHVVTAQEDLMTARELEEERQRDSSGRAYEIVRGKGADGPVELVRDLPPAALGQVLFYDGHFWLVEAVEPAHSRQAAGRLIMSLTTNAPNSTA